jgi:hypothetical protein
MFDEEVMKYVDEKKEKLQSEQFVFWELGFLQGLKCAARIMIEERQK